MNLKRTIVSVALALSLLVASLAISSSPSYAHSLAKQTATHEAQSAWSVHRYWNGVLITLSLHDEIVVAWTYSLVTIGLVASGFGNAGDWVSIAAAAHADYNYRTHHCDWFWIGLPTYGSLFETGTYSC